MDSLPSTVFSPAGSMERPWYGNWPEGVPKTIEYPKIGVAGMLTRAAKQWPHSVATRVYRARLTYPALDEAPSRFAGGLPRIGGGPRGRGSPPLPNCPPF